MEVGKLNPPNGGIFLYNIAQNYPQITQITQIFTLKAEAQRFTGWDAGKPGGWKAKLFAGLSAL
jgi:hypothetical protein